MSTLEQQIGALTEKLDGYTSNVRDQFGATKERLEKLEKSTDGIDELKDRLAQAAGHLAQIDEVKQTVLDLQQKQTELARLSRSVAEYDRGIFKHADQFTSAECMDELKTFMQSDTRDGDELQEYLKLHDQILFLKAFMEPKRANWDLEKMHEPGQFGTYHPMHSKSGMARRMWRRYEQLSEKYIGQAFLTKAFNTSDDTEWIPDILSSQLMRFLEVNGAVIPLFRSFPMPGPTFRVPITTSVDQAVLESAGTTATTTKTVPSPQLYATSPISRVTFDAIKLRAHKEVFSDFVEDSIIPMIPFMQQDMGDAIRRAIEDGIINADDTSPYQDSDNTSTTHVRRAWQGLRTLASANSAEVATGTTASVDIDDLISARQLMGRYGIVPSQVAMITGIRGWFEMLNINTIETIQNVGARATIITGTLREILGSVIAVSEYVREDLNVGGDADGTSTSQDTVVVMVHTPSWWLGNWRGITLERDRMAETDSDVVYARWRGDFQKVRAAAQTTEAALIGVDAA